MGLTLSRHSELKLRVIAKVRHLGRKTNLNLECSNLSIAGYIVLGIIPCLLLQPPLLRQTYCQTPCIYIIMGQKISAYEQRI